MFKRNTLKAAAVALTMALLANSADASTVCMVSLAGIGGQQVIAASGNTYTSNTNGVICGVALGDKASLGASGYVDAGIFQNGLASQYTQTFSVLPGSNPIVFGTTANILVASVNASVTTGYSFISGVTGVTVYPQNLTVMASGTASVATSEKIVCEPSGNLIATIPIAALVTSVPVGVYSSTGSIVPGPAFAQGCQPGDSVNASTVGSALATTTNLFVTMPYTTQITAR